MKLITFPFRLLFRLVVLPIKLVLATLGVTLKTGLKVSTLPLRGGVVFSRALGFKAIVLFALGLAGGVALTRRFGAQLGLVEPGSGGAGPDPMPSSGASTLVVEETVIVEEVDVEPAHADGSPLEQVRGADSEDDAERVVDIDAEVSGALGETPGEHA